jgi:hypothetical protein
MSEVSGTSELITSGLGWRFEGVSALSTSFPVPDTGLTQFTYARCMRRVVVATVLAVAALLGLTSCAADVQVSDVYKIGCPAVDAAAGGGSMVSKVTLTGLKKLSESGKLDPEPQRWLDATISLLESDNPNDASSDAKKLIIDGCAKNGYPLHNLG